MININKVFDCMSGNNDITEEFIYAHSNLKADIQYEVLSSSTNSLYNMGYLPLCTNKKGKLINVFENKQGILVARNGKAGTMRYLPKGHYTINDHAYILFLKDSFKKKYNLNESTEKLFLNYFIAVYCDEVRNYSTNNDNATWHKNNFFKSFEIEDFSIEKLNVFSKSLDVINNVSNILNNLYNRIKILENKVISVISEEQFNYKPISDIFEYCSRNDSLSEEGIYNRKPLGNNPLIVLSGSSKDIYYGKIDRDVRNIHYVENKQCIHLVSRGEAGKLTYISKGNYATNTNAFLLYFKDSYLNKWNINTEQKEEVLLKYYIIYLQPLFKELSSLSDVSIFPLTKVMKSLKIPEFQYSDNMATEIEKYDLYVNLKEKIYNDYELFNTLMNKHLII